MSSAKVAPAGGVPHSESKQKLNPATTGLAAAPSAAAHPHATASAAHVPAAPVDHKSSGVPLTASDSKQRLVSDAPKGMELEHAPSKLNRRWLVSLMECCCSDMSDFGTCCCGCLMPCCAAGKARAHVRDQQGSCGSSVMYCVMAPLWFAWCGSLRTRYREKEHIDGSSCTDCMVGTCFPCCTATQMARDLRDAEQHKKDKAKKRAAMRNTGPLTPEQAAIKIQKVVRGKQVRDQMKKEQEAAVKIQKVYRGAATRKTSPVKKGTARG